MGTRRPPKAPVTGARPTPRNRVRADGHAGTAIERTPRKMRMLSMVLTSRELCRDRPLVACRVWETGRWLVGPLERVYRVRGCFVKRSVRMAGREDQKSERRDREQPHPSDAPLGSGGRARTCVGYTPAKARG